MVAIQYIEKFTSYDGTTTSYAFDVKRGAIARSQNLRTPLATAIGADGAHDFNGVGQAARDPEMISMSWVIQRATAALVDAEIDLCRSTLLSIGKGRIYTLFADGSRRWAYARLNAMPTFPREVSHISYSPMAAVFVRLSNWHGTTALTGSPVSITTQGTQSFTITNGGNVYVRDVIWRLRANAWQGFQSPLLRNATTGDWIISVRSADTANSEIKLDGDAQSAYYSSNDGATYTDDYARILRSSVQNGFMSLAPGTNTIVVCNGSQWPLLSLMNPLTPNFSLEFAGDPQWS